MPKLSVHLPRPDSKLKAAISKEQSDTTEVEEEQLIVNTTIVTHCILMNDHDRLKRCLEDATDPYRHRINDLINERDKAGKSPLDLTAGLGRTELTSLLIQGGADVNSVCSKGYNCLHHAAAWGKLDILKILVENGGNIYQRNIHGELPRDIALRYNRKECASYLEIADEKAQLLTEITQALGRIHDMDKSLAGRITREEKNLVINTCKANQEWLTHETDASALDIGTKHSQLSEIIQPILMKLSEPRPESRKN